MGCGGARGKLGPLNGIFMLLIRARTERTSYLICSVSSSSRGNLPGKYCFYVCEWNNFLLWCIQSDITVFASLSRCRISAGNVRSLCCLTPSVRNVLSVIKNFTPRARNLDLNRTSPSLNLNYGSVSHARVHLLPAAQNTLMIRSLFWRL